MKWFKTTDWYIKNYLCKNLMDKKSIPGTCNWRQWTLSRINELMIIIVGEAPQHQHYQRWWDFQESFWKTIFWLRNAFHSVNFQLFNHKIPMWPWTTVFENCPKSLIQNCERSELHFHFEWTKVHLKMPKIVNFASLWKLDACIRTALSYRSVFREN